MRFDLKRPCAQCPFRTDVAPYLRAERVRELERELVQHQKTFSCHKTVDYKDDEGDEWDGEAQYVPDTEEQHCAGALILLEKIGQPNQMMRWMERCHVYDRTKLDMDASVFNSFAQMRNAQLR